MNGNVADDGGGVFDCLDFQVRMQMFFLLENDGWRSRKDFEIPPCLAEYEALFVKLYARYLFDGILLSKK